jgi:hypothetical protein
LMIIGRVAALASSVTEQTDQKDVHHAAKRG